MEDRIALAITFQLDYSYDISGFFASHPQDEAVLQEAGEILGSRLGNDLAAITPDPAAGETWDATFLDPEDPSQSIDVQNLVVPADTLIVYVGTWSGGYAGYGGPGGVSSVSGVSSAWEDLVLSRGQSGALATPASGFGPWGGMVTFDPSAAQPNLPTALHELCHVLGFGTASSWFADVDRTTNQFIGPNAEAAYGGPVPLDTTVEPSDPDGHWANGTDSAGAPVLMEPTEGVGEAGPTPLDWAGLADVGWQLAAPAVPTTLAATAADGSPITASTFGQAVGLVAGEGSAGAVGTVTFFDGAASLGSVPFDASGQARLSVPELPVGEHTIVAEFVAGGTSGGAGPTQSWALINVIVDRALPTIAVSDAGGTYDGGAFGATATVAGVDGQAASSLEGVPLALTYL